jgi:hypothetical protein
VTVTFSHSPLSFSLAFASWSLNVVRPFLLLPFPLLPLPSPSPHFFRSLSSPHPFHFFPPDNTFTSPYASSSPVLSLSSVFLQRQRLLRERDLSSYSLPLRSPRSHIGDYLPPSLSLFARPVLPSDSPHNRSQLPFVRSFIHSLFLNILVL